MTWKNCPRFQYCEKKSTQNKNKLERKFTLSSMKNGIKKRRISGG